MAQRGTPEPAEWRLGQLIAGPGDVGKVAGVTAEGFGLVEGTQPGAYVTIAGDETVTGAKTFTDPAGLRWEATIPEGTVAGAGMWDITFSDTSGYLIHINVHDEAQAIGIGINDGIGLVVNSYVNASRGILLTQQPGLVNTGAYGMLATTQSADAAGLVRLEQNVVGAAPALQLVSQENEAGQRLLTWSGVGFGGDNIGGYIDADTGRLVSLRGGVDVYNNQFVTVLSGNEGDPTATRARLGTIGSDVGLLGYRWSGSGTDFFASAIKVGSAEMLLQQSSGAAAIGAETLQTLVSLYQGKNVGLAGFAPGAAGFGGGYGVVGLANANASFLPSGAVTGGVVLYSDSGKFKVLQANGDVVNTTKQSAIGAPSGGATVDTEARTAINSIRAALTAWGITA